MSAPNIRNRRGQKVVVTSEDMRDVDIACREKFAKAMKESKAPATGTEADFQNEHLAFVRVVGHELSQLVAMKRKSGNSA